MLPLLPLLLSLAANSDVRAEALSGLCCHTQTHQLSVCVCVASAYAISVSGCHCPPLPSLFPPLYALHNCVDLSILISILFRFSPHACSLHVCQAERVCVAICVCVAVCPALIFTLPPPPHSSALCLRLPFAAIGKVYVCEKRLPCAGKVQTNKREIRL